jgi:AcrR family transcriptional regulator
MFKTRAKGGGMNQDINTKEKILQAAVSLLAKQPEPDRITVRDVAREAGVGVGLINYHFHSREELLSQAIGSMMAGMAGNPSQWRAAPDGNAADSLADMLKGLYNFAAPYEKLMRFVLVQGIQRGETDAFLYMVPLLREALPGKDEFALRVVATQILWPLQAASISPDAFHSFSGVDLRDKNQRDRYIDTLVHNLLG